ncbi:glycoside hydrolase family 13 protein [Heyndrickxia acidiproducens]|uniref:glycoside hydrolase family 13 protein n=1 Tax=Heyndrickxia acidiproducens TaxID=1121084 RepID=UPI0003700FA1|nr:glycoside hydrolase family 13 protein [Heyndrickxia acidiproducens]
MDLAGIFHQPFSADAYAYDKETMHIKIRTKKQDIAKAVLIWGDPYLFKQNEQGEYHWESKRLEMKKMAETEAHDYWFAEVKPPHSRLQYAFLLDDGKGKEIFYGGRGFYPPVEDTLNVPDYYFKFPYIHETDMFKAPDWVKSTVWYQIFPERFANGNPDISPSNALPWGSRDPGVNDFFGGDLQGIIGHLDYLQDLGIGGLYLTPIFESPSNHKYDTLDYFSIDPHFGDKETFRKLVEEAHKRGIKVMLDAVFNHIGKHSAQWQDVLKNGEKSHYKDWFHIHSFPVREGENGNIDGKDTLSFDTFAFTTSMPKLNTANPEVQKHLLDIATYWIREFHIDGWRLDVANEVDHAFWKKFHKAVIKENPDLYILGEIWHDARPWLLGDEFHSVMNYPFTQTIIEYFVDEKITAEKMVHSINQQFMHYMQSNNEVLFNMLDSHDTPRILTRCGGNKKKVKLALGFMFAHTGSPCLYYGTEVGMDGGGDPLCRKCMIWEEDKQDRDMLAFTKKLIQFRKQYQHTLTYGELDWLKVDNHQQLVGFLRKGEDHTLLFVFNRSDSEKSIPWPELHVEHPQSARTVLGDGKLDTGNLVLPAQDFVAIEL